MRRLISGLAVTLMLVSATGCTYFVKEPRGSVQSTDIVSVDTAGFDIELLFNVENQNSFDIALLGYTYDLQVMSVPFSSGGLHKGKIFPSRQHTEIRLPFRVRHADLLAVIKRRPDFDHVPYHIDARLNLDTPFGEISIPVEKKDTVAIPETYRPVTYLKRMLQPLREMF